MIRKQVIQRFLDLGGKTTRNAIIIVKEKYSKAGRDEMWDALVLLDSENKKESSNYPKTTNCACCHLFVGGICEECPLNVGQVDTGCDVIGYREVTKGLDLENRSEFDSGCNALEGFCATWLEENPE